MDLMKDLRNGSLVEDPLVQMDYSYLKLDGTEDDEENEEVAKSGRQRCENLSYASTWLVRVCHAKDGVPCCIDWVIDERHCKVVLANMPHLVVLSLTCG